MQNIESLLFPRFYQFKNCHLQSDTSSTDTSLPGYNKKVTGQDTIDYIHDLTRKDSIIGIA